MFQLDALLDLLQRERRYRCFHLDGQTSLLRDYLDIRPERRDELAKQLRAGRIMIGPWFVMSDEFLASGESLVRNLIAGARHCADYGVAPTPIGYVTDNFGHCSQLPQMLRSIGLRAAILHYGTSGADEKTEMVWEGADGSEVLLVKIHIHSSYTDFDAFTRHRPRGPERSKYIQDKKELATTTVLYGMDGGDHQPARPDTLERMRAFAEDSGFDVVHSSMGEYLDELFAAMGRDWTRGRIRFRGELRTPAKIGAFNTLHQATGSSRLPIKQANDVAEWLLIRAAEPLAAWSVLLGERPQRAFLHEAWRYLLLTHPHDSIVGCSVDQAHRDMMYRFDQARLIATNSIRESVQDLGNRIGTAAFGEGRQVATIFNGSAYAAGPVIVCDLELPTALWEKEAAGRRLALTGTDGVQVPVEVLSRQHRMRSERCFVKGGDGPTSYAVAWAAKGNEPVERLRVAAPVRLPALGYRSWRVDFVPFHAAPAHPSGVDTARADPRRKLLENGLLQVVIREDGSFDLLDRTSGRWYRRLHQLEDVGDAGDGWNFREPTEDLTVLSTDQGSRGPVDIAYRQDGELKASATIRYAMRIPADLLPEEPRRAVEPVKRRSPELVELPIEISLSLLAGQQRLEIRTAIRNTARSHRLRAIFPTWLSCRTWFADSPFDVVERQMRLRDTTGWREKAREHHPIRNFVAAFDGTDGLGVLTRGLCEACVQDKPERPIALTLYRAFLEELMLHRTQDSQLLGDLTMEYALVPFRSSGNRLPQQLFSELDDYKAPRLYFVAPSHAGPLPSEGSLLRLEGPLVLSTVKTAEDGQDPVVRIYNPHRRASRGWLIPGFACRTAQVANLLEAPTGRQLRPDRRGRMPLSLRPKEILTLRLVRDRSRG